MALIKPDAYGAGRRDVILDSIRAAGFTVRRETEVKLSAEKAGEFYREHAGRPFYDELVAWMSRSVDCLHFVMEMRSMYLRSELYLSSKLMNLRQFLAHQSTQWNWKRKTRFWSGDNWLDRPTLRKREKNLQTGVYTLSSSICLSCFCQINSC